MSNKLSDNGWYVVDVGTPFISEDNEYVHFIQAGRLTFDVVTPTEVCEEEASKLARLLAAAPELLEALIPFANYACDPPCGCHNCVAKAAITKAKGEI